MHKIYLTEPELSVIHGAEIVAAEFGGFPSMENGEFCSINISDSDLGYARYDISLIFDIWHWAEVSSRHVNISKPEHRFVKLLFRRARDISINSPHLRECGEFKFGNTFDRRKMHQDDLPTNTPIVERPFCTFYMRSGHDFVIEFDESECEISASFCDRP